MNQDDKIFTCENLSTGEKQSLSVARLLYNVKSNDKLNIVSINSLFFFSFYFILFFNILKIFLDEITSGMDEYTEEKLYSLIVEAFPTIISIGK